MRRLTDDQVSYYRAAHRLHILAQRTRSAAGRGTARTEELAELSDLDTRTTRAWFVSGEQARQWRRIAHGPRRGLLGSASR
ncbi:hypothetical protein ACFV6Z_29745 [Streptomyces sp. NPDC059818]|uniref:hypothetical protein n=1 Tax=Streptomyces sp. NPDC059818 TaxID=3346962 RepID=UPI00365BECAD